MSDPNLAPAGGDDDDAAERRIRRCAAIWRWALGAGIIVAWEVFARLKIIDPYYFSSPTRIVNTAYVAATQGTLLFDIGYTSASTIVGFIVGVVAGALIGLSTWWSDVYGRVSEPYLVTFNAIPKLALAPILIILFGIGFEFEGRTCGRADDRSGRNGGLRGRQKRRQGSGDAAVLLGGQPLPSFCKGGRAVGDALDRQQPAG